MGSGDSLGGVWGDARITIVLTLDKYVEAGCCGMGALIIGHGALRRPWLGHGTLLGAMH